MNQPTPLDATQVFFGSKQAESFEIQTPTPEQPEGVSKTKPYLILGLIVMCGLICYYQNYIKESETLSAKLKNN